MSRSSANSKQQVAAIASAICRWYGENATVWPWRATHDRWSVLVAEICLQQTQVQRAAPFVERILERFPTSQTLASAPLGDLLELWHGLGYPRRARNLWLASQLIAERGWPADYRELPGVGAYTDQALRCFADGDNVVPVDINTRRIGERLFGGEVPPWAADPWTYGQALMDLGQKHCRSRPQCDSCPVASLCRSRGTDRVIASTRQKPYVGSMRQRRGAILRAITSYGHADALTDPEAADSLVRDGLAQRDGSIVLLP